MSNQCYIKDQHGNYTPAEPREILNQASQILSAQLRTGDVFDTPDKVRQFISCKLGHLEREVFSVMFLDTKHRLICFEEMFQGTIDGASVYPREIVKRTLALNAAAAICTHNHPSGIAEPSAADQSITTRLKSALALVDIRLMDHIIVGGNEAVSFSERGLM